jgi:hypothetical protein
MTKHPFDLEELRRGAPLRAPGYGSCVIPAPYQVRGKLRRESSPETLDSPVSSTGQAKSSPE